MSIKNINVQAVIKELNDFARVKNNETDSDGDINIVSSTIENGIYDMVSMSYPQKNF